MPARILHVSDLHFGTREDPAVEHALATLLGHVAPDLVIASGDLTHRGRRAQHELAHAFLTRLGPPVHAVPGNHDIPYTIPARFTRPWAEFERTIGARFHSLFDVLAFDPGRAASRVATNLFVHRALDARELVSPALAVLALPGLALLGRRREGRAWIGHAFACALVLAFVFYGARFALYLLPLYLACAGAAFAWAWWTS